MAWSCQISTLGWRENCRLEKQFTLNSDDFLHPALLSSYPLFLMLLIAFLKTEI